MNREFVLNVLFVLFINVLIKPIFIFGIDRTVQNTVGAETYGLYFALLNLTYLFQIINDFGIQNFNSRNLSQHGHLISKYFPNIFALKIVLSGIYTLVTFLFAFISGYDFPAFYLLFFLVLNQIFISGLFFLRSNLSGLGYYRLDSILTGLDKFLMILICGFLLFTPGYKEVFKIEWFVYSQTISYLLAALVAFGFVARHINWSVFRFKRLLILSILKRSVPYALIVFLMSIYTRVDGVMIERLLPDGQYESGVYASAYRLLDATNMIGYLFAGLLIPMLARLLKAGEPVAPLIRISFKLFIGIAISIALPTIFFREEVMFLLYDEATPYWGKILGYLISCLVAISGTYIFGSLMVAYGKLASLNWLFVISVGLNIGLNFWLIGVYKAEGAACATVVTQFFAMIGQIYIAYKAFPDIISIGLIIRIISYLLFVALLSLIFYNFAPLNWIPGYLGLVVLSGLSAMLFNLVNVKEVYQLLRKG